MEKNASANPIIDLQRVLTIIADLGFLCVLVHFGMGGLRNGLSLLKQSGPLAWGLLAGVLFLLFYRSDYRTDVPLFVVGVALGYWGEWWGTTQGVWEYWNNATPPVYLPPLWGIGLLTVYRLAVLLAPLLERDLPRWVKWTMFGSFFVLPLATLIHSWPLLAAVDWQGRLDIHFVAGLVVGTALILYRFELRQSFLLYLCGTLLGGTYEYLGTSMREWTYITGEAPPLWIAPLWGLATVAMTKLALLVREAAKKIARSVERNLKSEPERG